MQTGGGDKKGQKQADFICVRSLTFPVLRKEVQGLSADVGQKVKVYGLFKAFPKKNKQLEIWRLKIQNNVTCYKVESLQSFGESGGNLVCNSTWHNHLTFKPSLVCLMGKTFNSNLTWKSL